MKNKISFLFFSIIVVPLCFSCSKEQSFESGSGGTPATGMVIKDSENNCIVPVIHGDYYAGIKLNDSNYVEIELNITKAGKYTIATDTANGVLFIDSGFFNHSGGIQTVKLKGTGAPALAGITTFTVVFDTTSCSFAINIGEDPVKSDTAWKFNDGTVLHYGSMDSTFIEVVTINGSLQEVLHLVGGKIPNKDTIITLRFILPEGNIQAGVYNSHNINVSGGDFTYYHVMLPRTNPPAFTTIYEANPATTQIMQLVISSYNPVTGIVKGVFIGSAKKTADNTTVNIAQGEFQGRVFER